MRQAAVGVDVGGSGVRAMALLENGKVSGTPITTDIGDGSRTQVLDRIVDLVRRVGDSADHLMAVGVGLPAFLSRVNGVVALAPNLPDLTGWAVRDALTTALGMTTVVENDANAAAFGEYWMGAGRQQDPFICLTLGTGVGGGIVLGGELLTGADGMAAELGHLTVWADGAPCGCGSFGCLEAYASSTGLLRAFNHETQPLPRGEFTRLYGERADLSGEKLAGLARTGDATAQRVFTQAGQALGIALSQLTHVFNPRGVVIGGGLAGAWDLLSQALMAELRRRTPKPMRDGLSIQTATLGQNAGLIGAAGLAWRRVAGS